MFLTAYCGYRELSHIVPNHCIQQGAHLPHLATGKVFAAALPEKVATLADPGTNALAVVETVAAIAKRATVFFIVYIILYWIVQSMIPGNVHTTVSLMMFSFDQVGISRLFQHVLVGDAFA